MCGRTRCASHTVPSYKTCCCLPNLQLSSSRKSLSFLYTFLPISKENSIKLEQCRNVAMDGLLSLKDYISKPRKCPKLAAWRNTCEKEILSLRLHHSWPSLHHQDHLSDKIVPAQIDRDPFAYFLSPSSDSTSEGSPVELNLDPASKSEPELLGLGSRETPASSHFLPQHSPTSSSASRQRRQQQREKSTQHDQPALTPEIVEIRPKIPEIVIWPAVQSSEIEDALSPLPEPFVTHSPSNRGRPQPRIGSKSRSRRTPPRSWRPRHVSLQSIAEEGSEEDQSLENAIIGLGIR